MQQNMFLYLDILSILYSKILILKYIHIIRAVELRQLLGRFNFKKNFLILKYDIFLKSTHRQVCILFAHLLFLLCTFYFNYFILFCYVCLFSPSGFCFWISFVWFLLESWVLWLLIENETLFNNAEKKTTTESLSDLCSDAYSLRQIIVFDIFRVCLWQIPVEFFSTLIWKLFVWIKYVLILINMKCYFGFILC